MAPAAHGAGFIQPIGRAATSAPRNTPFGPTISPIRSSSLSCAVNAFVSLFVAGAVFGVVSQGLIIDRQCNYCDSPAEAIEVTRGWNNNWDVDSAGVSPLDA